MTTSYLHNFECTFSSLNNYTFITIKHTQLPISFVRKCNTPPRYDKYHKESEIGKCILKLYHEIDLTMRFGKAQYIKKDKKTYIYTPAFDHKKELWYIMKEDNKFYFETLN